MSDAKDNKATDDVSEFIRQAVKRHNRAESAEAMNRQRALDDLKFKAGDQWPEQIRAQRTLENRPCLTINKLKTFVHQITNDQRQNRPSINISPIGDRGDPETAKMLKGLIKQIERTCHADIAYDIGFESAVSMGWGYWRILTDYEDEDSFDQIIQIKAIHNPFTVYLDPDAKMPDGSDAAWGFISELMPRDQFNEDYPNADDTPWMEGSTGDEAKTWSTPTHIRVAEYFYTETDMRRLVKLQNGHVGYFDELDDKIQAQISKKPDMILEDRDVPCKSIKWCKLTAREVLEENEWAGKFIPIVKVVGDVIDIEGKPVLAGIIRDAKDSQNMYNFWSTSETELIALAPKAPWVLEEGQVEGYEDMWKGANNKSLPYLLYRGTNIGGKPSPPPQRQQFAGPPNGIVQAKIAAAQDMQATTGIRFDATLQERNYDESGKALRELKRIGDIGNFHYIDNFSRSLKHTGNIIIDLIPKIYDTPRIATILREDGGEERVKIDPTMGKPHDKRNMPDGRVEQIYNPKWGRYDVTVTIGPSYATKRQEAAESMMQFLKVMPQAAPVVADLVAKNMDWPGAEEIYARLASMLPPHLQNKKLEMLPPEAKAMVGSLLQQMQQLKAEHDKAVALLGDKERDRAIEREGLANERESIARDFEAKMAKVLADVETKLAIAQAKTGGDNSGMQHAELALKFEKIQLDFEAKIAKLMMDMEAKRMQEHTRAATEIRRGDFPSVQELGSTVKQLSGKVETKLDKLEEARTEDKKEIKELAKTVKTMAEKMAKPKKKKGVFAGKAFEIIETD